MAIKQELTEIRATALIEANKTAGSSINATEVSNDGLIITIAQRYEHYLLTGENKLPGKSE